jgi:hypothetical protein
MAHRTKHRHDPRHRTHAVKPARVLKPEQIPSESAALTPPVPVVSAPEEPTTPDVEIPA